MLKLNENDTFHYELMRVLSSARYRGADIAEVLDTADKIKPGNFESWYEEFHELATRVEASLGEIDAVAHPVSAADALFRASSYYRAADFFLHGDAADPRINRLWRCQTECFNGAIELLPVAGERLTLQADGFTIPAIFYRASDDGMPRPTFLMCNGYDGSQEEMLHVSGFAALERGIHVLTFEGPGQPTVRRDQGLGFISEWEQVVTPLVNFCEMSPEVDMSEVGLLGYSMGGFLVARAAAFEHRLKAVICVDGIYDVFESFTSSLPTRLKAMLDADDEHAFNAGIGHAVRGHTHMRWAVEQGLWSFKANSPYDLMTRSRGMSLRGLEDGIQCPALVCDAEHDRFFQGQPEQLMAALGSRATYRRFTAAEAAGEHCHVGASVLMNQVVMDWFTSVRTTLQTSICDALMTV